MSLLDFVFRLGVLFAIYGFLWGIFEIGLLLLAAGQKRSIGQTYFFKAVKYFFLVDVTFLFCMNGSGSNMVVLNQVLLAGIILLTYFLGKLQQNQNRQMIFKVMNAGMPFRKNSNFNLQLEVLVISLSLLIFGLFWFFPEYSQNPISVWFYDSIVNIEDTPVFGFIFKVIGFFFLVNLFFKMINSFNYLVSGGLNRRNNDQRNNDDHFDDYEEIS